ncbi:DUF2849 domain-containing protein [Coralliovum pocilloporae]|uniref:DUF2849 domain-containing protein n=1 Tax=Coralliovum pocilloporae TaxID=3066369 RepID=UPI0033074A47
MKVITANRLREGDVVWFGAGNVWVHSLEAAHLYDPADVNDALTIAQKSIEEQLVVDVYDFDVQVEAGAVIPKRMREKIRAAGPTVRQDLGKQAELQVSAA